MIAEPTDAVVRVVLACVCGSDLWYYRGESPFEPGRSAMSSSALVEEVGGDVRLVSQGDLVFAPFRLQRRECPIDVSLSGM